MRKTGWIRGFEDAADYSARADSIPACDPWAQGAHAMGSILMLHEALDSDPLLRAAELLREDGSRAHWRLLCRSPDGARLVGAEHLMDAIRLREKMRSEMRGPQDASEAGLLRDAAGFEGLDRDDLSCRMAALQAALGRALSNLAEKAPLFASDPAASPASRPVSRSASPRELASALGLDAVAALFDAHELSKAAEAPNSAVEAPRPRL